MFHKKKKIKREKKIEAKVMIFYVENYYEEIKYRGRGSLDQMKDKSRKFLEDCCRGGGSLEAYKLRHELRRRRALVFAKSQKRKGN